MLIEQAGVPIISINALEKTIKLGRMDALDQSSLLSSFPKVVNLEDGVCLYSLPLMDLKSGEMVSSKCFICTNDDIIETEGVGMIPFENNDKASLYMNKLEKMIEWQH